MFAILLEVLDKEKSMNPPSVSAGFFFVGERFEISNLDILIDIKRIMKLEMFVSRIKRSSR